MKKLMSLLLAAVMLLSFAACSGNGGGQTAEATQEPTEASMAEPTPVTIDKNDTSSYLGTWVCKNDKFDNYILVFNKGGIGRGEPNVATYGFFDFTYEVKEEVVVITYHGVVYDEITMLELNDDGTVLSVIQNGLMATAKDDKMDFVKTN